MRNRFTQTTYTAAHSFHRKVDVGVFSSKYKIHEGITARSSGTLSSEVSKRIFKNGLMQCKITTNHVKGVLASDSGFLVVCGSFFLTIPIISKPDSLLTGLIVCLDKEVLQPKFRKNYICHVQLNYADD